MKKVIPKKIMKRNFDELGLLLWVAQLSHTPSQSTHEVTILPFNKPKLKIKNPKRQWQNCEDKGNI